MSFHGVGISGPRSLEGCVGISGGVSMSREWDVQRGWVCPEGRVCPGLPCGGHHTYVRQAGGTHASYWNAFLFEFIFVLQSIQVFSRRQTSGQETQMHNAIKHFALYDFGTLSAAHSRRTWHVRLRTSLVTPRSCCSIDVNWINVSPDRVRHR